MITQPAGKVQWKAVEICLDFVSVLCLSPRVNLFSVSNISPVPLNGQWKSVKFPKKPSEIWKSARMFKLFNSKNFVETKEPISNYCNLKMLVSKMLWHRQQVPQVPAFVWLLTVLGDAAKKLNWLSRHKNFKFLVSKTWYLNLKWKRGTISTYELDHLHYLNPITFNSKLLRAE